LYLVGFGGHVNPSAAATFNIAVEINGTVNTDFFRVNQRVNTASTIQSFSWSNIRWMNTGSLTTLRLMWKSDGVLVNAQSNWYLWALEVGEE